MIHEELKISLNDHVYSVKFVESHSPMLQDADNENLYHFGMCHYKTQIIYICENLNEYMTKFVLAHEITHALVCSIGMHSHKDDFDAEDVCEFVAANARKIIELTDYCYNSIQLRFLR